jgi:5'(3')-deoxyribonucleotidase
MQTVFFDMDNVLVDFQSGIDRLDAAARTKYEGHLDECPGIFSLMDPVDGAIDSVYRIAKKYDTFVLTTAPWLNPSAWTDKILWIQNTSDRVKNPYFIKKS